MDILELGCGWGSLSLYMAEHFPKSRITAVSNSTPQRLLIEGRAKERGCVVCEGGGYGRVYRRVLMYMHMYADIRACIWAEEV